MDGWKLKDATGYFPFLATVYRAGIWTMEDYGLGFNLEMVRSNEGMRQRE